MADACSLLIAHVLGKAPQWNGSPFHSSAHVPGVVPTPPSSAHRVCTASAVCQRRNSRENTDITISSVLLMLLVDGPLLFSTKRLLRRFAGQKRFGIVFSCQRHQHRPSTRPISNLFIYSESPILNYLIWAASANSQYCPLGGIRFAVHDRSPHIFAVKINKFFWCVCL